MYSLRRDPNHSYYHAQYWTMNCRQEQDFFFGHQRMIKTKRQCFSSTKFLNQKDEYFNQHSSSSSQKNSLKSSHSAHSQDIPLPVYRAPCTFQNSLITTDKGNGKNARSIETSNHFRWFISSITSVFIIIFMCT